MTRAMHILSCALGTLVVLAGPAPAAEAAPSRVHYQGQLFDSAGQPVQCAGAADCPSGPVSLTFRLYAQPFAGELLWAEEHGDVAVKDGVFNVVLGESESLAAVDFDIAEAYLGVEVNGTGELSPRQQIVAVAYALLANRSSDLACTGCVSAEETSFLAGCAQGEVLALTADGWGCGQDADTMYSGADFAISGNACADGEVMQGVTEDGTPWCVPVDVPVYGGTDFALSGSACLAGEVMQGVGDEGGPICVPDTDTTYGGWDFAMSDQGCSGSQKIVGIGANGDVLCADDVDTTYTGLDFAVSGQSCSGTQKVVGIDSGGVVLCDDDVDTDTNTTNTYKL